MQKQIIIFLFLFSFTLFACKGKAKENQAPTATDGAEEYTEPSPNTFTIGEFSEDYYGKLYVENQNEVFTPGWVAIYRKSDNKEIIKVESEELAFDLHDGEVKANIRELHYGEQSVIT